MVSLVFGAVTEKDWAAVGSPGDTLGPARRLMTAKAWGGDALDRPLMGSRHDPAQGAPPAGVEPRAVPPPVQVHHPGHLLRAHGVPHDPQHQAEEPAAGLVIQLGKRNLITAP